MLPSLGRLPLAETGAKKEGDESGLTRSLKNTSLVPTGACLPRGFDPDYCAYDGYYAIGVALVSTVAGFMVDSKAPRIMGRIASALSVKVQKISDQILTMTDLDNTYIRRPDDRQGINWDDASGQAYRRRAEMPTVFVALDAAFRAGAYVGGELDHADREDRSEGWITSAVVAPTRFQRLGEKLLALIRFPMHLIDHPAFPDTGPSGAALELSALASIFWSLKYIAHYMNEHALMVASFFRVNAKNLRTGDPLMLNLKVFARQCREDIADGPNPPPPPPAPAQRPLTRSRSRGRGA